MPKPLNTSVHALAVQRSLVRAVAVVTSLLAAPAAWAGFSFTRDYPLPSLNLEQPPYFSSLAGAFGLDLAPGLTGSGVAAEARYVEWLQSRLPTLTGSVVTMEDTADSGWVTTQQAGRTVTAIASLAVEDFSGVFPAAARAGFMSSHVFAHGEPKVSFSNSGPVTYGGADHAANTLYKRTFSEATATASWYDSWTAGTQPGQATVQLAVDGLLRPDNNPCAVQTCAYSFPPGTGTAAQTPPSASFLAEVAVFDLGREIPCLPMLIGPCGPGSVSPVPVEYMALAYTPDAGDSPTLALDAVHTALFQPEAGHRYLAVGRMLAVSHNGAEVDFFNTAKVQVLAPAGTLYADGLGGADLGLHFAQAVPEPGTLALWAAGLLGLGLRLQRRRG